jgi:beta-lactamase class A
VGFNLTFSALERALTLVGLAPAMLIGAGVHQETTKQLLPPSYRTLMPVPAAEPKVQAPAALTATVNGLRNRFDGLAGISVRSVEQGWTVDSADANRRMPQQSVSKLWVAMTVLDAVDQGRITLDDRLTITKSDLTLFHQPIAGLLKDGSYTSTVRDFLHRALTMSDNTCNDRLLRYVGGPTAVRAFLTKNGIDNVRFGPGERLLQSKTAGLEWKQDYAMGRAFEAARAKLPRGVRQAAYQSYIADPIDGAAPAAIAGALAKLKRGALLSPTSTSYLMGTMESSRTGKQRMRGAVPPGWSFGHKTGTGQDLLRRTAGYNDVGLLTAPDGQSYAIAIMIGDTSRTIPERQALMQSVVTAVVNSHR